MLDRKTWINFLALLPSTLVTLLAISVAFLRFYDQSDFEFLGWVAHPRIWSNRCTVAAVLAALANFGVEWNNRNRETDRLAQEEQRRGEDEARRVAQERAEANRRTQEEQRRSADEARRVAQERTEANRRAEEEQQSVAEKQQAAEERERAARRARIEARCRAAQIRFQLDPNEANRQGLINSLAVLEEYGDTL